MALRMNAKTQSTTMLVRSGNAVPWSSTSQDATYMIRYKLTDGPASGKARIFDFANDRFARVDAAVTGQSGTAYIRVSAGDLPTHTLSGLTDAWLMVVGVYDATAGTSTFYYYNADTGTQISTATGVSTGTLNINGGFIDLVGNTTHDVILYDLVFWDNRALTSGEVATLVGTDADGVQSGDISNYWLFNRTSGGNVDGTETELDGRSPGEIDFVLTLGEGDGFDWVDDQPGAITVETTILSTSVHENGHWVDVTLQTSSGAINDPTTAGWTVDVGGSPVTLTRAQKIAAEQIRLWVANGSERILTGDTVTISYDPAVGSTVDTDDIEVSETVDAAVTNNSEQTATSVFYNSARWSFASSITAGITVTGRPQVVAGSQLSALACEPYTGEEQRTIGGMQVGIDAGNESHAFDSRDAAYDSGEGTSVPYTPSAGDAMVASVVLATDGTWQAATAYSLGDVLYEGSRYRVCTKAGTSGGVEPTWAITGLGDTIDDNGVEWAEYGSGPVTRYSILEMVSSLKDQTAFAKPYARGATDPAHDYNDINTGLIPGDTPTGSEKALSEIVARLEKGQVELGVGASQRRIGAVDDSGDLYGQRISPEASAEWDTLATTVEPKSHALACAVQVGIDLIGLRQEGAFWPGDGGHAHGRLSTAMITAALLGVDYGEVRTPAAGSTSTDDWRGWGEGDQLFYVTQADIDRADYDDEYDYGGGGNGTFVDPANMPSIYSDSPATAYFPASVQDTWLHTPEFARQWGNNPKTANPRWDQTPYRVNVGDDFPDTADILLRWGVGPDDFTYDPFWDYVDRYVYVESVTRDSRATTERAAYAVESSTLDGTTLTVTFNRYTTGTSAAWQTAVAGSGSTTCTGAAQTGPRTWEFTLSGAPASGETIDYTAASGDAVDAENNALPDTQLNQPAQLLPATTPGAAAVAGSTTITLTYSEPIENTISPLPAADITVSNAATGNAELVTEDPAVSGSTITIVYEGDPAATDAALTVSLNNGDNHVLTVSNGLPIASLSEEAVSVSGTGTGTASGSSQIPIRKKWLLLRSARR
jgi:hypothetical protein